MIVAPDPAMLDGLKVAVGPAGDELILKLTVPVNPPSALTVMLYCAVVPSLVLMLLGETKIEKSLAAVEFTVCESAADVLPLKLVSPP